MMSFSDSCGRRDDVGLGALAAIAMDLIDAAPTRRRAEQRNGRCSTSLTESAPLPSES